MDVVKSNISLYNCNYRSWLHNLHPYNKLIYILFIGVSIYSANAVFTPSLIVIIFNFILMLSCRVFLQSWKIFWRALLPLSCFMIIIHGFLSPENHTPLFHVGSLFFYQEGLFFALSTLLKLAALLSSSLLYVTTCHPADLMSALSQSGWPAGVAYMLGSPLLMIPAMREKAHIIQTAQKARGLNIEGGIISRIKGIIPLVLPLILGSLIEIEQRATALEIRGFKLRGEKTAYRQVPDSALQIFCRWFLLASTLAVCTFTTLKNNF